MARKTKYTIDEVKPIALENGFIVVDDIYVNTHSKLTVICKKCKIEHRKSFYNIRNRGCAYCSNKVKYTYDYVKQITEEMGFDLLSKEYSNVDSPLLVRCNKCKTEHNKVFWHIKSKNGCF